MVMSIHRDTFLPLLLTVSTVSLYILSDSCRFGHLIPSLTTLITNCSDFQHRITIQQDTDNIGLSQGSPSLSRLRAIACELSVSVLMSGWRNATFSLSFCSESSIARLINNEIHIKCNSPGTSNI